MLRALMICPRPPSVTRTLTHVHTDSRAPKYQVSEALPLCGAPAVTWASEPGRERAGREYRSGAQYGRWKRMPQSNEPHNPFRGAKLDVTRIDGLFFQKSFR